MSAALRDSLHLLLTESGHVVPAAGYADIGLDFFALPSDFTSYFDLLAVLRGNSPRSSDDAKFIIERATAALRRLSRSPTPAAPQVLSRPKIITLRDDFLAAREMASLVRWWDMEPDNSMDLVAVEAGELEDAARNVHRALDEIEQASPALYGELLKITREIVIARPGDARRMNFGGVSSFAAWGAIALNYRSHQHWADYLRTLVHETAHLLLFAIARDEPLVLNDATERIFSPLRDDSRPIDGIFHAAFVSAREALALDACLNRMDSNGSTTDELERNYLDALLSDSVVSFAVCYAQLTKHARLSSLGNAVLQEAKAYMDEAFEVTALDV